MAIVTLIIAATCLMFLLVALATAAVVRLV